MNQPEPGSVVFLSGDLMFASRVRAAAEKSGLKFVLGGSLPHEETSSIRFVVLDLATRSSLTKSLAGQCASKCPEAVLIAYGPHVQAGKIQSAKDAGIPVVMTRGQFDSRLGTLFTSSS